MIVKHSQVLLQYFVELGRQKGRDLITKVEDAARHIWEENTSLIWGVAPAAWLPAASAQAAVSKSLLQTSPLPGLDDSPPKSFDNSSSMVLRLRIRSHFRKDFSDISIYTPIAIF